MYSPVSLCLSERVSHSQPICLSLSFSLPRHVISSQDLIGPCCSVSQSLTVALDLLRKRQGRRRGTRRRRAAARSSRKLEHRLRGVMRTARRASNVEVPSFLRQLERPILEKYVSEGGSKSEVNYAVASMQGWRAQMEDAHTCMPQLRGELTEWGYFAVFDGHAGTTVAQYCSRNLLEHIFHHCFISACLMILSSVSLCRAVWITSASSLPASLAPPRCHRRHCSRRQSFCMLSSSWLRRRCQVFLQEEASPATAGQDDPERGGERIRQRDTSRTLGQYGSLGVNPTAHPGARARARPTVAAFDQGGAGGGRGGSGLEEALCEQLPYLRSLGIGALILEGLFDKEASSLNVTATDERLRTLAQIQHVIAKSHKAGLKVVLDFCELDVAGNAKKPSNLSATVHHVLRFWLEQGVAGFAICDTDAAYSEKTLLEWRSVFKEFSSQEEERILVVKQTRDVLSPLNNITLVDVVMRSILPSSQHLLSAKEVADAIETRLQTREEDIWPSWTVGGKASDDLKKLLLVLMMTLPGSPAVKYDEDINQTQNLSLTVSSPHESHTVSNADKGKTKRSAVALFSSLSSSRAREEALLYGSFTFLPFNSSSTNSSSNSTFSSPSSPPVLAFLRSWGCVHFLVLLNVGPEVHSLNPAWAPSLPEAGVFVTSTGMDRLGSMTLNTLELRPHEAVVIKLFEAGSYS